MACEVTLHGTPAGVPASLGEAQARLAAEAENDGDDPPELHEQARAASAHEAAARAQLEQARRACDETRGAIVTAEQAAMPDAVARLEEKLVAQRVRVEEVAQAARTAIRADLPWPVETAGVDAALLLCDREEQAALAELAEHEKEVAAALTVTTADVQTAEQAQGEAERAAAECRAADPEGALVQAQAIFVTSQRVAAATRSRLTPLAERVGIAPERSALEGERGRVERAAAGAGRRLATREDLAEQATAQSR